MDAIFSQPLPILRLRSTKPDEPEYHRLWGCNEAPSEHERVLITSRLRQMQLDLQRMASNTLSSSTHDLKTFQEVEAAIRRHEGLLSCVRRVPPETWGRVFEFIPEDTASVGDHTNPYDITLQRVCSVCSTWNAVAKSVRSLWTRLPVFAFGGNTPFAIKLSSYQAVLRRLDLYLSSSGTLPISFSYRHTLGATELDYQYLSILILERLMKESSRWLDVEIKVPVELMDRLSHIRDKVTVLKRLNITVTPLMAPLKGMPVVRLDAFAVAPSLRHVVFNFCHKRNMTFPDIVDVLPWPQIETYACNSSLDIAYEQLLRLSKDILTSVSCTTHTLGLFTPQNIPVLLPHLTKLHLRVWNCFQSGPYLPGNALLNHLRQLTLPALEDLEVRESRLSANDHLEGAVIGLISRSGCFLKRLALDEKIPIPLYTDPSFIEWVKLWANLTNLDIRCPGGERIQTLDPFVLGPGSLTFPELQVLTLRRHLVEPYPRPLNDNSTTVDPEAFFRILENRMPAAYAAVRQAGLNVIPEVRLVYTVPPFFGWALGQVEAFEALGKEPFGDTDIEPARVEKWASELDKAFCTLCYLTPCTSRNLLGQRKINTLVKELEQLDLEGRCSRILVVRS